MESKYCEIEKNIKTNLDNCNDNHVRSKIVLTCIVVLVIILVSAFTWYEVKYISENSHNKAMTEKNCVEKKSQSGVNDGKIIQMEKVNSEQNFTLHIILFAFVAVVSITSLVLIFIAYSQILRTEAIITNKRLDAELALYKEVETSVISDLKK